MIDTDYDLLREQVKSELLTQDGKYNPDDRDTNVRIVEDIRKAIDAVADGVVPSATHIAEVAIATNANLQIRSEPPNPQLYVGPWNQSSIEPDFMRPPLNIGSGPQ